ncbi:MAG: hypothetical protein AAF960_23510 [Bacteroidota bacterium]
MKLQTRIFEAILPTFPKKRDAVVHLASLLNLQQNAIYRKLRGDSLLTPDEITLIVQHFKISLDTILHEKSDVVLFSLPSLSNAPKNFSDYLYGLVKNMEHLATTNGHIHYAAAELPLFHYCFFPEIIAFKLYTWGRTTWKMPYLQDRPFDLSLLSPTDYDAIEALLTHYLNVESTELWNLNVLDNTLNQIEYCIISGQIADPKIGLVLCDKLLLLVEHLQKMAKWGKKFPFDARAMERRTDFNLFHNEMIFTGNSIIVTNDLGKAVYSTFDNPNYIKATQQRAVAVMEHWFESILQTAQPISKHSEKIRRQYFRTLVTKVEQTKSAIQQEPIKVA